jgi:hypothetical protein
MCRLYLFLAGTLLSLRALVANTANMRMHNTTIALAWPSTGMQVACGMQDTLNAGMVAPWSLGSDIGVGQQVSCSFSGQLTAADMANASYIPGDMGAVQVQLQVGANFGRYSFPMQQYAMALVRIDGGPRVTLQLDPGSCVAPDRAGESTKPQCCVVWIKTAHQLYRHNWWTRMSSVDYCCNVTLSGGASCTARPQQAMMLHKHTHGDVLLPCCSLNGCAPVCPPEMFGLHAGPALGQLGASSTAGEQGQPLGPLVPVIMACNIDAYL